jgi:hypothetical protein
MKTTFSSKAKFIYFFIAQALALGWTSSANAACNNQRNWFDAPVNGVKIFIGYRDEQPGNFEIEDLFESIKYEAYPAPLPSEMFGKEGSGNLSSTGYSNISYYEPDGKGKWRLCRRDGFWPERVGQDSEIRIAIQRIVQRYTVGSPLLRKAIEKHTPLSSTLFFYDEMGRIASIEKGDFEKPDKPATVKICRRYDEKNRITLLLKPISTQSCTNDQPDLRDSWLRFRYGEYNGEEVPLLNERHFASTTGKWRKEIYFSNGSAPNDPHGVAKAKSEKGVTIIYGSNFGKLDDNAANTVVDAFGRVNAAAYFFTQPPVPLDVLEHPELIYKYERRRQTYIEGQLGILFELFQPNEHITRHRYYFIGRMLRNEQLDANGKVTRVITVDDYRQPRPGPHPDVDDKLLTDKAPRLIGHQIYHRVYDIDVKGKPKLIAVSWNRKLRLNPLKKTSMTFADMAYGTPDGKIRWKTAAEFEKAFGFSTDAVEVFPDEADGKESEQI